jgi:phosphoglycolate phosphatase
MNLIIFDLDGTLVDSAPAFVVAANRIRSRKGLPPIDLATVRNVLSNPSSPGAEASLLTQTSAGGKELRDSLMTFGQYFEVAFQEHAVIYDGMISVLDILHVNGIHTALVSGRLSLFLHQLLYRTGLADRFEPVVGSDTVSAPPPAPDAVRFVLDQTGIQAQATLLVSDSWAELQAAQTAGVMTAWAQYGYGSKPDFTNDFVLAHPVELLRCIGLS